MFSRTFFSFSLFSMLAAAIVLLASNPSELRAQSSWTEVDEGTTMGTVYAITFGTDDRPIIATAHGLYRGWYDRETEEFQWIRFDTVIRFCRFHRSTGGTLFAGTHIGIYASEDNGLTWDTVMRDNFISHLNWFVQGESTVGWYDLQKRTLRITNDRGKTVISRTVQPTTYTIQSSTDGTLYGTDYGIELYASSDQGVSWRTINIRAHLEGGIGNLKVIDSMLFVTDNSGVLRSDDAGASWQRVQTGLFPYIVKGEDEALYEFARPAGNAAMQPLDLLMSTDAGATWSRVGTSPSTVFAADRQGKLLTSEYGFMRVSQDKGATWKNDSRGLTNVTVNAVVSDPLNRMVYAAFTRSSMPLAGSASVLFLSLHRSADNGRTWSALPDTLGRLVGVDSSGTLFALFDSLSIDSASSRPEVQYVYRTDKTLKVSRDFGDTWKPFPLTLNERRYFLDVAVSSAPTGVTVIDWMWYDPAQPGAPAAHTFFLSTNSGAEWQRLQNPLPTPYSSPTLVHVLKNGSLLMAGSYAADTRHVFGRWRYEPASGSLTLIDTISTNGIVEGDDGRLYSFSNIYHNGRLYVSEDDGRTWEDIPAANVPFRKLTGLKATRDGTLFLRLSKFTLPAVDTIYRSTDRGATWKDITVPPRLTDYYEHSRQLPAIILEDGRILDTLRINIPGHPFDSPTLSYHYYGLGWSDNNGDSWSYDTAALNLKHITALARTPSGALIVGTQYDGLFLDESTLSVPPAQHSEQATAGLQVLPVPSGDRARALFRLETAGTVRLELYDLLGRRIAVLAHATLEAGEHAVPVPLDNLPAGSYLLQLSTDAFTESVAVPVR